MKTTPEQKKKIIQETTRLFNGFHSRDGVDVMEINMLALGLITRSMQECIGKVNARDVIESAMDNVWGKKKKGMFRK